MKNYSSNLFPASFVIVIIILIAGCQTTDDTIHNSPASQKEPALQASATVLNFFMPDSIPEVVWEKASEISLQNKFANCRILQVENSKSPTFNIYYFSDDGAEVLKSFNVFLSTASSKIDSVVDVTNFFSGSLKKALDEPIVCWDLGDMCKYSPYQQYYAFVFGQSAQGYGWFSKTIFDLRLDQVQCAFGEDRYLYLGSYGYNDAISSKSLAR